MSFDSLSIASTQNDDEEKRNLDDLLPKAPNSNDRSFSTEKSLGEDIARTSSDDRRNSTRTTSKFQTKTFARPAFPGMQSQLVMSPFPSPLMGIGPMPSHAAFSTPNRNMTSGSGRSRQHRSMTPRNGFGGVRRQYKHASDLKYSPDSQNSQRDNQSVFSNGAQFGSPVSPLPFSSGDDYSRMKPLSRTSPFVDERGNHGPRCSQPNNKGEVTYPLVFLSPGGSISILLHQNLIVETAADRSVRVVNYGLYSAYMDHRGTASSIIHSHVRILHKGDSVSARFSSTSDKMVVFGRPGVLFSMDNLREAYLISANHKSPTAVAVDRLEFPKMNEDCTLMQFYRESQTGTEFLTLCKEIVDEATYDRKADGTLVMHINGMTIRYWKSGDLHIDARPRHIKCTADGSVHVRTTFIDTSIQSTDMAFIKFGAKRVHISRSGMVVSDGSACTSMDQFGRIIAST